MSKFIYRTAGLLVILTLVGRLIGFVRNILLTNEFGVGIETDAYLIAFTIPSMLFLVIPGVINAVVVPPLKGAMIAQDREGRKRLFRQTFTVVFGFFALLTIGLWLAATPLVHILAPGFTGAKHDLTVELTRQMIPSILLIGLSALFQGVLSAHNKFFLPATANTLNGLIVIAAIAFLAPGFGMPAVAWSVTLGFFIYTIIMIPALLKLDYTFTSARNLLSDDKFRAMGERFFPILFGLLITQLYMLLEKVFASTLGDAKLTALGLANTIFQLPLGVFSASLVLPLFPLMTEQVKKLQWDELRTTIKNGFLIQYHLLLPMSVAMMILPEQIVKLLYQHGSKFTDSDVHLTAWALIFIATGMIGWIGRDLMTRVFYALEDTKTPVVVATFGFAAYALFAWLFIPLLDHAALAFSYALTSTLNMLVLAVLAAKRIQHLFNRAFYFSIIRGLIAATVMALVIYNLNVNIMLLTIVGAALYALCLIIMKEPILVLILKRLKRR